MKLLLVITRGELGGAQRHVVDLIAGLKQEHALEVATGEDGYLTESARALGVPVHLVPRLVMPISPLKDIQALLALSRLIAKVKPDLVHAHTSKAGVLGRAAARMNGVPCLFTAHTWCFSEGTAWKWKAIGIPLEKLAARWSEAIINVSEANRRLALENRIAPADKLITIHNGIPDTALRAAPGGPGIPTIVMIARFAPQKAQADLLRAVHGIKEPFRVIFIGDGPTRPAHEELASQLGIRDRVEFLGVRRDIEEILASAHIFALPSNWEGFPLTILEGMRAGLPVVASNVGGVAEAIVDGTTGFLTPAGSISELRSRLRQLLADPALRASLGTAGRARYEAEFAVRAMLGKTAAAYEAISSKGPPPVRTVKFSLILATVDRSDADLGRLFESLCRQTHRDFEVVIVDQNADRRIANILSKFQNCFPYVHLTSARGLSKARNQGLQHATGDVLAFPDDDCWYAPDLLATVAGLMTAHPEWDGITGSSSAGAWGQTPSRITRANAWSRGISFSMFLRRAAVASQRFDETLGVGAGTPWGSGEETDYLLQALAAGAVLHYRPEVKVDHPPWDFSPGSTAKARAYGRGMGRWLRKHRFRRCQVAYHVVRPLAASAFALLKGDRGKACFRWATCVGRFEGWVKDYR